MAKRRPAVAGAFYTDSGTALRRQIEECFTSRHGPGRLPRGGDGHPPILISPHAGYVYSGPVAAHGYLEAAERRRPSVVIVIGPNHYGIGSDVSIYPGDAWITPLGEAEVNSEVALKIARASAVFSLDEFSHAREHSIEVQVPFLQYIYGSLSFVPICMLDQSIETARIVGEALAEAIERPEDALVVATTDFTHYEPHEEAVRRDTPVIERMLGLDIDGFYAEMERNRATLCGYGAAAAAMTYASLKGYRRARLLKYATSGDTSGDRSAVVGYASIIFERTSSLV